MLSGSVFHGMAPIQTFSFTIYNGYFDSGFKKILFKRYFTGTNYP